MESKKCKIQPVRSLRGKKQVKVSPRGPYLDHASYMKDCVQVTVRTMIPFEFWDDPLVHKHESFLQSGFNPKSLGPYKDQKLYLKDCVRLTVRTLISLTYWNDPLVHKREGFLQSGFKVALSDKLIRNAIIRECSELMELFSQLLRRTLFSIKIDLATRNKSNILGVSAQFILGQKVTVFHIGLIAMAEKCTPSAIIEKVEQLLATLSIPKANVHTITMDNGAHIFCAAPKLLKKMDLQEEDDKGDSCTEPFRAMEYFHADLDNGMKEDGRDDKEVEINDYTEIFESELERPESIRCAAHVIQIAVRDFLKKHELPIKRVKEVVKQIRKDFDDLPRTDRPAKPTLADNLLWSSTYRMMESLLNIKDRLLPSSNYDLDWQFISAMQQVLKPVSTLTTQSQAEQYLAGDFKRDYAIMRFAFEKLRMHAESATVLSMIEEMKLCLRSRESAFDHPAFLAALYLDPRYNNVTNTANLKKMTREQLDVGRNHLCQLHERSIAINKQNNLRPPSPTASEIFDMYVDDVHEVDAEKSFEERLAALEKRHQECGSTDILNYWSSMEQQKDQEIATVAAAALAIPTTQETVEKGFGQLAFIIHNRMRSVVDITLTQLLLMRMLEFY